LLFFRRQAAFEATSKSGLSFLQLHLSVPARTFFRLQAAAAGHCGYLQKLLFSPG